MAKPFRLYGADSCPHCKSVKALFRPEEIDEIIVGFDPVAQAGLRAITNGGTPIPFLISYPTQSYVVGADLAEIARVISVYRNGSGAGSTDTADSKTTPANPSQPTPTN